MKFACLFALLLFLSTSWSFSMFGLRKKAEKIDSGNEIQKKPPHGFIPSQIKCEFHCPPAHCFIHSFFHQHSHIFHQVRSLSEASQMRSSDSMSRTLANVKATAALRSPWQRKVAWNLLLHQTKTHGERLLQEGETTHERSECGQQAGEGCQGGVQDDDEQREEPEVKGKGRE
jgi:hypothetical protein